MTGFGGLLTVAVGWVWGSFLNQLIDRSPRRVQPGPPGPPPGVSWRRPARSLCFGCGTPIPWHDNVPIVSWLVLRGRCRQCGAAIGARTLAVEAATPLLFAAVYDLAVAGGDQPPAGISLLLGLATVSEALLLTVLALEGRRVHPGLWGLGGVLMAGWGLALGAELW